MTEIDVQTPTEILKRIGESRSFLDQWGWFTAEHTMELIAVVLIAYIAGILVLWKLSRWYTARKEVLVYPEEPERVMWPNRPTVEQVEARNAWLIERARIEDERRRYEDLADSCDAVVVWWLMFGGVVVVFIVSALILGWLKVRDAETDLRIYSEMYRALFGELPGGYRWRHPTRDPA